MKACLIIIDGFGISEESHKFPEDAKFLSKLKTECHYLEIFASGEHVGLFKGMVGNSEVGHLTIGSGRIIDQAMKRIRKSYYSGRLKEKIRGLRFNGKVVHLIGLLSDAGIHSHTKNLKYIIRCLPKDCKILIHAISDGIDVPPRTIEEFMEPYNNIVSVTGRYFAMDRDQNWDRTEKTIKMLINGPTKEFNIKNLYNLGVEDEYIEPCMIEDACIKNDDIVIIFNHRPDRVKQLYLCLKKHCTTYTLYEIMENDSHALVSKHIVSHTLPEWIYNKGLSQIHIAESEKSAHVSSFFNGGREIQYPLEELIIIPSPKAKYFEQTPEMSMIKVGEVVIQNILKKEHDFILVNFAGPDLIGHTGNIEKVKMSIKKVDNVIESIYKACIDNGYALVITSDHGNCEQMFKNGQKCKSHTTNKVPLFIINTDKKLRKTSEPSLKDIAPTILCIMGLSVPKEMTGESLVI